MSPAPTSAQRAATRRGTRSWPARLALLAFGIALASGAGELALRWVRPQPVLLVDRGLYAPATAPLRYRLAPGFHGRITNRVEFDHTVSVDSLGLRGPELERRLPGRLRILALGDSFTFGVGVDDDQAWPMRLAKVLDESGVPTEGLDAGAPGYGVPDEAAWLDAYMNQIDPDLVLLAVFPGNDLHDAAPGGPKMEVVNGELRRAGERSGVKRWLYYHSHLFAFLKLGLPPSVQRPLRTILGLEEPLQAQLDRQELSLYDTLGGDLLVESGLAETGAALQRLRDRCALTNAPLAMVVVPSLPEVDDQAWSALERSSGDRRERLDRHRPTHIVEQLGVELGLPVLDLTPALVEATGRGERVYYPIDRHLTAAGHDAIARAIAAFLRDKDLLQQNA